MTMAGTVATPRSGLRRIRDALLLGTGVAAGAAAITIMSQVMRSVGEVGGSCADGGPYVSAQPCPDGTGASLLAVLGLTIFFIVATLWGAARLDAPQPVFWAWPALFFTLGWNFLEEGLVDPPDGAGVSGGYLFCGVLFWVMAAAPLLLGMSLLRTPAGRDRQAARKASRQAATGAGRAPVRPPAQRVPDQPEPAGPPHSDDPGGDDPAAPEMSIAGRLERLAALHASGELTDDEYRRAKAATLREEIDR